MRTVILASHGHLASGMKNTVEMILGEQEALQAFDAYTTPECNVHDTLEAMLRQADGECVIVTENVLGGSVNKEAVVFAAQPGVRVITGMNYAGRNSADRGGAAAGMNWSEPASQRHRLPFSSRSSSVKKKISDKEEKIYDPTTAR